MVSRRIFCGLLAAFCTITTLAGCGDDAFPDYNYKMTVYVGDAAFSSVRRVEQESVTSIVDSGGRTINRWLTGEAVIIDAYGKTYYALLTKPDNADYALMITGAALGAAILSDKPKSQQDAAVDEWRQGQPNQDPNAYLDDIAARSKAMTQVQGAHPLPRTLPARRGRQPQDVWPMFVTFDNPNDPKTVREVSPTAIGVSNITIEITDEDVTTGIEGRLNWLPQYHDKMLDGNRLHISNKLSNNLGRRAFKAEIVD